MELKSPLMLQPCEAQFYPEGKLELSRAVLKPLLLNISMPASKAGITILSKFPNICFVVEKDRCNIFILLTIFVLQLSANFIVRSYRHSLLVQALLTNIIVCVCVCVNVLALLKCENGMI